MSGADRKPSGAPFNRDCSYWRERITLCGQTKLQLPHWMHSSESQAATISEMLRFSYCVVPLGYVPSTGSALTGSSIAAAGHHRGGHGPHELRCVRGNHRRRLALGRHLLGQLDAVEVLQRAVDRRLVALDDVGAALAVGLGDRRLDPLDRLLALEHARDREEACLKHRVGPPGEARIACDLRRVDHVELDLLGEDLLLNRARERVPDAVRGMSAVEQERRSRCRPIEHLGALEQPEVVAADEAGLRDEVGRANRFGPEAQVRDRLRA